MDNEKSVRWCARCKAASCARPFRRRIQSKERFQFSYTMAPALESFKLHEWSDDDVSSGEKYWAVVGTLKTFPLLVKTNALGASFRMAAQNVPLVCSESGPSFHCGQSDIEAFNYTRAACVALSQITAEALCKTCGFSTALDCSTFLELSYLDVHSRLFFNDKMHNFHVSPLSLFDRHTGRIVFEGLVEFSDAQLSEWSKFLVNVSSEGHRSTTGRVQGVLTRTPVQPLFETYITWCDLY